MKNTFVILISFLLLMPSMQVHSDSLVHDSSVENHSHLANNQNHHHKKGLDNNKQTNHHHCCTVVSFVNIFLPVENSSFAFISNDNVKKNYILYNDSSYSSYLEGVFQPPKVY